MYKLGSNGFGCSLGVTSGALSGFALLGESFLPGLLFFCGEASFSVRFSAKTMTQTQSMSECSFQATPTCMCAGFRMFFLWPLSETPSSIRRLKTMSSAFELL